MSNTTSNSFGKNQLHENFVEHNHSKAWRDKDKIDDETNLKIRGEYRVEEAKDWVDNGSRL